jgi:hypothetical protein
MSRVSPVFDPIGMPQKSRPEKNPKVPVQMVYRVK